MTLINISEASRKNPKVPLYRKLKSLFKMDIYWSPNLSSIDEHFKDHFPRRRDRWTSQKSAYILMYDLDIKRKHPDSFDENDGVSLEGIDMGFAFPQFEVRDMSSERIVPWRGGSSSRYLSHKEEFRFNSKEYVTIPETLLQYFHNSRGGWLTIASLRNENIPPIRKRKTLQERVKDLTEGPHIPQLEPSFNA